MRMKEREMQGMRGKEEQERKKESKRRKRREKGREKGRERKRNARNQTWHCFGVTFVLDTLHPFFERERVIISMIYPLEISL